jgi:FKBP-type peptidyl-prolyl cis-trans isomerase (trigger factor)
MFIDAWQSRPIEDALQAKIDEQAKRIVKINKIIYDLVETSILNIDDPDVLGTIYEMEKEALGE